MKTTIVILATSLIASSAAVAGSSCNIADVMFGPIQIQNIKNKELGYETGVIFGNNTDLPDTGRFYESHILGKIDGPERDGSRRVTDVNGALCGTIYDGKDIDFTDVECDACEKKAKVSLRKVTKSSYAVISGGKIVGTIEGALPKGE